MFLLRSLCSLFHRVWQQYRSQGRKETLSMGGCTYLGAIREKRGIFCLLITMRMFFSRRVCYLTHPSAMLKVRLGKRTAVACVPGVNLYDGTISNPQPPSDQGTT